MKNYRQLKKGEVILETDQWDCGDGKWTSTSCAGEIAGTFGNPCLFYRREIKNIGWNVTFTSRKQARLAAALMFKETIVKGPHKA